MAAIRAIAVASDVPDRVIDELFPAAAVVTPISLSLPGSYPGPSSIVEMAPITAR
jgi:hypothetical protein